MSAVRSKGVSILISMIPSDDDSSRTICMCRGDYNQRRIALYYLDMAFKPSHYKWIFEFQEKDQGIKVIFDACNQRLSVNASDSDFREALVL